jgi:putative ABC transport system permease protein
MNVSLKSVGSPLVQIWNNIATALSNLRVNKLRSILTMLGVIIGVSAVIIMVTIVEGARSKVVEEFNRLGSQLIIIVYAPTQDDLKKSTRRFDGLTMDDVNAIRERCDLIGGISAELPAPNSLTVTYKDHQIDVNADGIQPDYEWLRDVTVAEGRFITDDDIDNWSKACVIGSEVKKQLFPHEDPIGKEVEIDSQSSTVVGVLNPKGRSGGQDADKALLFPITSLQKRFIGREIVGVIFAQPKDSEMLDQAMEQVWETLMRLHDNLPGFRVDSQQNILNAIGRILTVFGLLLGGVAGLALLVGGIGIMNIMLVSVTERTREIGIRKAVGAKRRDILMQFLIESATVSGMGGLLGIGVGAGISYIIGFASKQFMKGGIGGDPGIPVHLPIWAVLGAFFFSAFVGIFFGIFPAMRAARLDPIEALRHE